MKFSIFSVADYYPEIHPDSRQFMLEQIDLAQAAEEAGYDAFFIAEHHFLDYGRVADPAVFLSAVAMKTTRIRLGPAVSVLPFVNPLRLVEQWAMLDQLSQGRLLPGVGSGYLMHEFEGFGVSPSQKRERFNETLEIIEHGLSGKRFSYAGQFYNYRDIRLNVTPYMGRKIEIAVAILNETAAYYVGRQGYGVMTMPYAMVNSIDELKSIYDSYRKGWRESGRPGSGEIFAAVHIHVGDKTAARDEIARKHLERYINSRLYARYPTYDECIERGVIATGIPDEVAKSLQKIIDAGANNLMLICNYGALPLDEALRTINRLQLEVVPLLN